MVVFAEYFPDDWRVTNEDDVADWDRLSQVVKARRSHLGLSQDRVRQLGGPSQPVQTQVETNDAAKRPRPDSLHKFDYPLQWEPGSTLTVLRGGDPTPLGGRGSIRDIDDEILVAEMARRLSEARRVLEGLVEASGPAIDTTAAARTRHRLRRPKVHKEPQD